MSVMSHRRVIDVEGQKVSRCISPGRQNFRGKVQLNNNGHFCITDIYADYTTCFDISSVNREIQILYIIMITY